MEKMPTLTTSEHAFLPLTPCDCNSTLSELEKFNLLITEFDYERSLINDIQVSCLPSLGPASKELTTLLPALNEHDNTAISSPYLGQRMSEDVCDKLGFHDPEQMIVQMVRCSHIDWHDDAAVSKENNLHPGVYLLCLSDNPYGMTLRMKSGESHRFKKGDWVYFDDTILHSMLPESPLNVTAEQLHENPMTFVAIQQHSFSEEPVVTPFVD